MLLCGDPDYYLYQGFVPPEMLGIRTADNMYAMALHVCELYDGALSGIRGALCRDSIYDIDPSAAEAFDRGPAKGKLSERSRNGVSTRLSSCGGLRSEKLVV